MQANVGVETHDLASDCQWLNVVELPYERSMKGQIIGHGLDVFFNLSINNDACQYFLIRDPRADGFDSPSSAKHKGG